MSAAGQSNKTRSGIPVPVAVLAELLFLDRLSALLRGLAIAVAVVIAGLVGWGLESLHTHFAQDLATGTSLNPLARTLATGSSWATIWPGWVAAIFFAIAVLRLHRGPAEPPAGRGNADAMSVRDLRAALRQEYSAVRLAFCIVAALALVDTLRFLFVATSSPGATVMGATAAEAVGIDAAAVLLAAWALGFRRELENLGAI